MRVLVIGDVIGRPGRKAVKGLLPGLRNQYNIDLVIANGENAAGGVGITADTTEELISAGIDVITTGNHVWAHKDIIPCLDSEMPILRPLNYPPGVPGRGYLVSRGAMVVNLMGRTFIGPLDCPFRGIDKLLAEVSPRPPVIIVDFHAEATSEKMAMGRYLDGRVSAVLGTHTHVGTIDLQVFPGGTAYVTDIGMTGPVHSVIGDRIELVLHRFLTGLHVPLSVGEGKTVLNAVMLDIDEGTGKAVAVQRIQRETD